MNFSYRIQVVEAIAPMIRHQESGHQVQVGFGEGQLGSQVGKCQHPCPKVAVAQFEVDRHRLPIVYGHELELDVEA